MTECITTPASCEQRPTVAVLGAGIAGLTAAQELAERGFVVTVYEPRADERNGLGPEPAGTYPPVKLGGLAASQYSTVGAHDGSQAELRPFPGRRGQPRDPRVSGCGRTWLPLLSGVLPTYLGHVPAHPGLRTHGVTASGTTCWTPTSRTVYDNVRRVVTQGMTVDGKPSLVFPRELPRSPAESLGILQQLAVLGFTPGDIATFESRLLRYLVTSPLRRARELQNVSAYDFFVGYDRKTKTNRFAYSPSFDALLREMPRVLAAIELALGGRAHQHHHLSAAVPEYGPPRQQGRRGAQRSHHRGRGSTTGTATSSHSVSASSATRRLASILRPSTRASRPICDPACRSRWPTARG